MAAEVDPLSFDPLDPSTMQCPFPHYAALRAEAPVHYVEAIEAYFVTRHDLVSTVARDSETFSSRRDRPPLPFTADQQAALVAVHKAGLPRMSTLITADPPVHTRYRRLVSKAFSPRTIARHEDLIRSIAIRLIDSFPSTGQVEFVEAFALPLPIEVIAKVLNVPDDRLADFKRWSDDTVLGFGGQPTFEELLEAAKGINELQFYFADALDDRRMRPQGDLLSNLLDARIDDDDPDIEDRRSLNTPEILSIIQQLLVGGNETTTKLLTETMLHLAENPEQWSRVKADPSLIPETVEETLRLTSPAQGMWRIATRDVELGGVAIAEGSRLVIAYGSANRDETLFEDPDEFQPGRANITDHVAFGKGTHFCIGAALARLETRVALEEIVRRVRSYSVRDSNDYVYNNSFLLRGLLSLDLDIEVD